MTPWRQQHLRLALLLSLLLHLTLLAAPAWRLPTLDAARDSDAAAQIEAHLSSPTARKTPVPAAPAVPATAKRRPVSTTRPAPVEPAPEQQAAEPPAPPPVAIAPQPSADAREAGPAAPEPAVPAAAESPLPRNGRIRFVITRGDQGFVIGQSLHRWSHDGKTYTLNNVTETTGLAALFRPVQVTQSSVGEISEEGLRPREFRTGKNGIAGDAASFEWTPMRLMLTAGNPREVALRPGAQDMLSMFYQLSARYPSMPREVNEVMVATGRKFERYTFEVLREEMLQTGRGELRTLHLRTAAGVEAIDIWSGLDLRGLPVKIRYTDRQGESFDQVADEIEFEGMPSTGGKP
jgi:hypothetical protein